jgi:hypothetical protein
MIVFPPLSPFSCQPFFDCFATTVYQLLSVLSLDFFFITFYARFLSFLLVDTSLYPSLLFVCLFVELPSYSYHYYCCIRMTCLFSFLDAAYDFSVLLSLSLYLFLSIIFFFVIVSLFVTFLTIISCMAFLSSCSCHYYYYCLSMIYLPYY